MPFIHRRRDWERLAGPVTPETAYLSRRRLLAGLGAAGAAAVAGAAPLARALAGEPGQDDAEDARLRRALDNFGPTPPSAVLRGMLPAERNDAFELDRPLSPRLPVVSYNNFYEFGMDKLDPLRNSGRFVIHPWTIEIAGLVRRPRRVDLDDLLGQVELEERLYRFRCVEAWSFTAPWTGFPLKRLIDLCEPLGSAKYVRFFTANRPEQMPGIRRLAHYQWPYYEALTMPEANNELALVAVGIYGRPLPNQNGAPLRLVIPWKYGYKSPKSIVKIEFVEEKPPTFWNDAHGNEYGFYSNVNPERDHPRWSQATERLIGTDERVPTLLYNGYADQVAGMYEGDEF